MRELAVDLSPSAEPTNSCFIRAARQFEPYPQQNHSVEGNCTDYGSYEAMPPMVMYGLGSENNQVAAAITNEEAAKLPAISGISRLEINPVHTDGTDISVAGGRDSIGKIVVDAIEEPKVIRDRFDITKVPGDLAIARQKKTIYQLDQADPDQRALLERLYASSGNNAADNSEYVETARMRELAMATGNPAGWLEKTMAELGREPDADMRYLLEDIAAAGTDSWLSGRAEPPPSGVVAGSKEEKSYFIKGEKEKIQVDKPSAIELAFDTVVEAVTNTDMVPPDVIDPLFGRLTDLIIAYRRGNHGDPRESLPPPLPYMGKALANLDQLGNKISDPRLKHIIDKTIHSLKLHTGELLPVETDAVFQLMKPDEKASAIAEEVAVLCGDNGKTPTIHFVPHSGRFLFGENSGKDFTAIIKKIREGKHGQEKPYEPAPSSYLSSALIEAIPGLYSNPQLRKTVYDLLNMLQVESPLDMADILWKMDRAGDLGQPLAFQMLAGLANKDMSNPFVIEQAKRREFLMNLLGSISPQECFDEYPALQKAASGLVVSIDLDKPPDGKIGMEVEIDRPTTIDVFRCPGGWRQGEDIADIELRKHIEALSFSDYIRDLAELDRLFTAHPTPLHTIHLHLDRGRHPNEPKLGGIYGMYTEETDSAGQYLWSRINLLNTWEVRGIYPGLNANSINPGGLIDCISLYVEACKNIPSGSGSPIDIDSPYDIKSWRQILFGHLASHLPTKEGRTAALLSLRTPLLDQASPLALGNSYSAGAIEHIGKRHDLLPFQGYVRLNKHLQWLAQSRPEQLEFLRSLSGSIPFMIMEKNQGSLDSSLFSDFIERCKFPSSTQQEIATLLAGNPSLFAEQILSYFAVDRTREKMEADNIVSEALTDSVDVFKNLFYNRWEAALTGDVKPIEAMYPAIVRHPEQFGAEMRLVYDSGQDELVRQFTGEFNAGFDFVRNLSPAVRPLIRSILDYPNDIKDIDMTVYLLSSHLGELREDYSQLLKHPHPARRLALVRAMCSYLRVNEDHGDDSCISILKAARQDSDPLIRDAVARAMGEDPDKFVIDLKILSNDEDPRVRRSAAEAMLKKSILL